MLPWIDRAFDFFFRLTRPLPPLIVLAIFSLFTALASLTVLRWISNQKAIRRTKDLLAAHVLEVRLFSDQPRVVLRAYFSLIGTMLLYLRYALMPLLVLALPLLLLFGQLALRFEHAPLESGRDFLMTANFQTRGSLATAVLKLPPEVVEAAPPVHIPLQREIDWELMGQQPGIYDIRLVSEGREFSKRVVIGTELAQLAAERTRGGLWQRITNPGELPLPPDSVVDHIRVEYPERLFPFGTWRVEWFLPYVVLTLVSALLLKRVLRVEI